MCERERDTGSEYACVCVCVSMCVREIQAVSMHVCGHVFVFVCVCDSV